jgi:hypothetical protein
MYKINHKTIVKIFNFTRQTWVKWRDEGRPITKLLEKYFTTEELEEFFNTEQIEKQELIKDLSLQELKNKLGNYSNEHNNSSFLNSRLYSLPLNAVDVFYKILKEKKYLNSKSFLKDVKDDLELFKTIDYLFTDDDIKAIFQNKQYYLEFTMFLRNKKSKGAKNDKKLQ